MSDFIDRIREAANIEALAGELTQLEGRGARRLGLCPFHSEKTPSFTVFVEQNRWHCFGCGRHGSAIDLVMESRKEEFWEAALILAQKYGIPVPTLTEEEKVENLKREKVETLLTFYTGACHRKLLKAPEALEYLHGRGVTDESMETYEIGLSFKLPKDVDKALAKEAGITDTRLVGRITFPIRRGGKVVQISARALDDSKPKYLFLKGLDRYPFNVHRLRGEQVLFVEGVLDAILSEQVEFPACATGNCFYPEWLRLIGRETNCYCCYDPDEAGAEASRKIGELLFDSDHKVYNIQMPQGHDPASLIQSEGAGAMQALMDGATSYIDSLITAIPPNLNSYELPKALEFIYSKLARLPATSHDRYTVKLAEKLSLSKPAIRKELKEFLRESKKRGDSEEAAPDVWKIRRRTANPTFFSPGQDYVKDALHYVIHFEIEGLGAFKPFIINSNRECFPYNGQELLTRDMILRTTAMPSNFNRWSIGTDNQYNALDYLDGKTHIDPKDLYAKVKWYFKKFCWLPDPFYYDFLTCWTIATYSFRLYDSFGYIFVNAMKRSGKTQTLSILSQLTFNGSMADALTEAVLKRRVNVDAATIIADEAEFFKGKMKDEKSMVFEVFNGGYKRTGRATMVDVDTKAVEDFCTYSPKALANVGGLYDVLQDRCISLYLLRSEKAVPQFVEAEHSSRLQLLRDMLYCFALEYIPEIVEVKKHLVQPEGLPGRDWELWHPVLTTAAHFDTYNVVEPEEFLLSDGSTKTIESLFERMTTMAIERREYRIALEEDTQSEARIMQAIWDYIQENWQAGEMYFFREAHKWVKEALGWDSYSYKAFSAYVFDTAKLVSRTNPDDRTEQWFTVDGKRKKALMIRLQSKMIQERAKQLFGKVLQGDDPGGLYSGDQERDPFEDE